MKIFALRDETNEEAGTLAYLECHGRPKSFFFEVSPEADAWDLPFILHEFVQRGNYTVNNVWSTCWVCSRLAPPERQNLGEILRANGLSEYDETRLLALSAGRCSQDGCYLVPASQEKLPAWYRERERSRLSDVYVLGNFRLLACLATGELAVCDMRKLLEGRRPFARVLADAETFARACLLAGGHGVGWGSRLEVSAQELKDGAEALSLTADDMAKVAQQALCDTAETMRLLGCTRQNVSDLVRRGKLTPLKATGKNALFLRADVLARRG